MKLKQKNERPDTAAFWMETAGVPVLLDGDHECFSTMYGDHGCSKYVRLQHWSTVAILYYSNRSEKREA